jgi:hypothetical protein
MRGYEVLALLDVQDVDALEDLLHTLAHGASLLR